MHILTWGHSCSALWIWGNAWRRSRPPAGTAPGRCHQWNWTCQTWPGRTLETSYCHHLQTEGRFNGFTGVIGENCKKGREGGEQSVSGYEKALDWWEGVSEFMNGIRGTFYSAPSGNIGLTQKAGEGEGGDAGVERMWFTWVTFASSLRHRLYNWEMERANETGVRDDAGRWSVIFVSVRGSCLIPVHSSATRVQLQFMEVSAVSPSSVRHTPVSLPETESTGSLVCVCVSCTHSQHTK